MSGGGRTVSRGRMGQKVATLIVDPKELESLEKEVNKFEENIRTLQQKQGGLENQVNSLQPQLRKMETDYEKFIAELQSLQKQKPTLEHQLKAQAAISKKTKANPEQVKILETVVMKKKAEYEEAVANTVDLQTEVDGLTKEIKDKTFGKMKNLDKNLNEVSKTIDKCKAEITRLRVAVTTSKRNFKKCADKITTMEQDIVNCENKLREMKAQRDEIEGDAEKLLSCIKDIEEKLVEGQEEYSDIKEAVNKLTKEENKLKGEKVEIDHKIKTFNKKLKELNASVHQWHVKLSQLKLQDVCNEHVEPLQKLTVEELENKNVEAVEKELLNAEAQVKSSKPNLNAIQEYQRQKSIFVERSEELDEITNRRTRMRELYDGLRNRRKEEFTIGYNIIRLKLKEMYQMITLGGDADFEMMDSFDPFTEGIQLNVRPPKKSWKAISNLSGGEKTLSSLALVFALHYYRPSPLYVMDEIDAALDFKNVSIVGHYIKERTKNAQFIIISLRSNMFELCDNLIGIYKTYECTKSITIDPRIYDQSNNDESSSSGQAIGLQDVNIPDQNVTNNVCQNAVTLQKIVDNEEVQVDSNPTEENENQDVPISRDVDMTNLESSSITSSDCDPRLNSNNDTTIDDSLDEAMECE